MQLVEAVAISGSLSSEFEEVAAVANCRETQVSELEVFEAV